MRYWKRFIVGCAVGNIVELYNFILYGCFSSIIAQQFFPNFTSFISLALTFSVFASGCLMRPLGAVLFGFLGDTWGRKKALIISLLLISVATTLIGLLPTYQQIGNYAPLLLIICRLMQGLSMSGEEIGAAIFLMENAPPRKQGFAGSIILGSVYIGLLLGTLMVFVMSTLFPVDDFSQWGWRIPFLLSALFGMVALWVRMHQPESAKFIEIKNQSQLARNPLTAIFFDHRQGLLGTVLMSAMLAVAIYLFAVYIPTYLTTQVKLALPTMLFINALSFTLAAVWTIGVGYWVDHKGAEFFMKASCIGFIIFAYPIFFLLSYHTLFLILIAEMILLLFLGMTAGALMAMLIRLFPANIRYTGIGIGFNVSMTIFGSLTPILALYLTQIMHSQNAPFVCLMVAALFTLGGIRYVTLASSKNTSSTVSTSVGVFNTIKWRQEVE